MGEVKLNLSGKIKTLFKLTLSLILIMSLFFHFIEASTIKVDTAAPSHQQPIVQSAANGVLQVDIQTPSAGGVSHNKYTQFDVSKEGVILNNSKIDSNTQLAGYVRGNDYLLRSGSARIILNEINAKEVSQLAGFIEVAGAKAQVVIANPSGITCDGCGFINANRATLTTGAPLVINGALDSYLVKEGQINVIGKGLDSSRQDYTDLIARSIKLNAAVWGNAASIIAGKNKVSADLKRVEKLAKENVSDAAPLEFGIDVSALGGMYAGKIALVGTEFGVGVRNAGNLGASADGLHITADGKIINAGTLTAKQDVLISNQSAQGVNKLTNQGLIDGSNVSLKSDELNNLSGARLYGDNLHLKANKINNIGDSDAAPVIGARGDLKLEVDELNNKGHGQLLSGHQLTINNQSENVAVSNSGIIKGEEVDIRGADLANVAGKVYGDTLYIKSGLLRNEGSDLGQSLLQANKRLELSVSELVNNEHAELVSLGDLSVSDGGAQLKSLTNHGLIDGGDVSLKSDELNNLSGARLYGDNLHLKANKINNIGDSDAAPVIGARGDLKLEVDELNNKGHGQLLSLNDLVITGNNQGRANEINNHSAKIEGHGDVLINANKVNNIDDNIEVKHDVLVGKEKVSEWAFTDAPNKRYKDEEVEEYRPSSWDQSVQTALRLKKEGVTSTYYSNYIYDREVYETQVIKKDPAKILSGKNLTFTGGELFNYSSHISAGLTLFQRIQIINQQPETKRRIVDAGIRIKKDENYDPPSLFEESYRYTDTNISNYNNSSVTSLDLGLSSIKENAANENQSDTSLAHQSNKATEPNLALPKESLYRVSPSPQKNYIIETDPSFINKKNWLSSDYMFSKLKADPATLHKRLGDGYYEQKLIREQITQLTGQRYLGDYTNDNEQYASLINNAAEFSGKYQLSVGVELSDAQMKALTTDIVWMVSKEVEIGGKKEQVLVPKVYVAKTPIVTGEGALISGREVYITGDGKVSSNGTISGKKALVVEAKNIDNQGVIQGSVIGLNAKESITSSGVIDAEAGLSIKAGYNVNFITKTNTTESQNTRDVSGFPFFGNDKQDAGTNSKTVIDKTSVVRVRNGNMSVSAGNDITSVGALIENLKAGSKTNFSAGKDINLLAVTTKNSEALIGSNSSVKFAETKASGASIKSLGDISFTSGGNFLAEGASVIAGQNGAGTIDVSAENVSLHGAKETVDVENHLSTYDDGFLSSSEHHRDYKSKQITQKGSLFLGGTVNLNARQEASIKGSHVLGQNINVDAGKVTIGASEEYYYEQERTRDKQSGLMGGSGLSVDIGTKKEDVSSSYESKTHQGSILSASGKLKINAKENVKVEGSDIKGANETYLEGANIDILDVEDSVSQTDDYSYEKTGLSLSLTGTASKVYNESKALNAAKKSKNKKIEALQGIKTSLVAAGMVADALTDFEQFSIGVSASFGTEKNESHSNSSARTSK